MNGDEMGEINTQHGTHHGKYALRIGRAAGVGIDRDLGCVRATVKTGVSI